MILMRKSKVIKTTILALFAMFLATSCSSTKVLSSWSLDSPPQGVMSKTLVLGVMQNRGDRDNIENEMVSELTKAGVNAKTSTSVFGPKGFQGLTEEQVAHKLRGSDYTSVMIISLIDKEKEASYSPGYGYAFPYIVGYSRYYRRYIVAYDRIYMPGYYRTNTNYVLEADLYTVNDDDELVYSAQTKSYDPGDSKSLAESFAKLIVSELKAKRIIE